MKEEVTYFEFLSHTKDFLKQLITKPSSARLDEFMARNLSEIGVSQEQFLKMLLDRGIVERKESIDDKITPEHQKVTFGIKYLIPRNKFERKMKKLHIELFEQNIIDDTVDEATGAGCSGQFSQPLFGEPMRKKIYITSKQATLLAEVTTTMNAGDYQYTVPFPAKQGDPTLVHNKPGGISCDTVEDKKDE